MERFDIFWVNLEPTICSEITKTRPCVIISPNELNYLQTRLIAPITSRGFSAPFRVDFVLEGKEARILCDQIRCVSVKRFLQKISTLGAKEQEKLQGILAEMFA
ncbi:type II toxin-antitoxin system PemK/MazF family toxin [Helicobacter canis]|uniref:type II toxin-antitoxin system PemK/MazF family toxin n=1 Tax=Helicobacter canis TaxID=29419 RepID=UPI002941EC4F|nr:type II toxin-antitoxin system PemK/MazF family toxin [Helicobacter canis]